MGNRRQERQNLEHTHIPAEFAPLHRSPEVEQAEPTVTPRYPLHRTPLDGNNGYQHKLLRWQRLAGNWAVARQLAQLPPESDYTHPPISETFTWTAASSESVPQDTPFDTQPYAETYADVIPHHQPPQQGDTGSLAGAEEQSEALRPAADLEASLTHGATPTGAPGSSRTQGSAGEAAEAPSTEEAQQPAEPAQLARQEEVPVRTGLATVRQVERAQAPVGKTREAGSQLAAEQMEIPVQGQSLAEAAAAGEVETAEVADELAIETRPEPPLEEVGVGLEGEGNVPEETTVKLQSWRANVRAAANAIPAPDIGDAAQGASQVRQGGGSLRGVRAAARERIPEEAHNAVTPAPEPQNPPPPPAPDPVPEASALVDEKIDRRLPDQTMPDLQRSPRGTLPQVGQRPTVAEPAGPRAVTLTRVPEGPVAEGRGAAETTPDQEQVDELRETIAGETPDSEREGSAAGVTLTDEPLPPPEPLPPIAQAAILSVLAHLLADPAGEAGSILRQARKAAYPNEKLEQVYPDIGNDQLPNLTESLTTELQRVTEEAGVARDELDASVRERQQALAQQRQAATAEIENTSEEERESLQQDGQAEAEAVAGAREAVDEQTEAQVEAARGEGDPTVVRARRDRLLGNVSRRVGQGRVSYEQAKRRREGQLDAARNAQTLAYRATAQSGERAILAAAADQSATALSVRLEAASIRDWAGGRERELERTVIELKRTAGTWADGYREELQEAGTAARDRINEWAEGRLGEQRSWWDRLFDLFQGWSEQARAESQAWETVRAGETRDAILTDFAVLSGFSQRAGESVDLSSGDALRGLSEEQQAVIRAYYASGPEARDPIGAVAAGIRVRLSNQRRPDLIRGFEAELAAKPASEWENLDLLGKAQQAGFSADRIRNELYQAMHGGVTGWGTDEERIFRALGGLTPVQATAVRKCYAATHRIDLDADIRSELGGAELTRAEAQLSGNQTLADVATLREAMHGGITGLGTDEDVIMSVLRGKSEDERQRIIAEYRRQYGTDLSAELSDELSSHDLERANALMEGNTSRADAIAIDQAMRGGITGWGTDEAAIEGVYQQIRRDVAAEGARHDPPWTTAQVEAEIARRNLGVESSYNARYGGDWTPGDESALRQAFQSELSGPELNLTNALADNDLIRADAARLAIEAQGIFVSDDDVINGVLRHQYERALEELRRDEWPTIQDELNRRSREEGWDPYRRRAEERRLERELEQRAQERSRGYMRQLEDSYDASYSRWGSGGLRVLVEFNMSGNDQAMARDLLAQGGRLTPAQEIHYAVEGAGTDEDAIRRTLAGRSPAEIAQIREEWNRLHPGEDMDERLRSELGGRDEFDTNLLLEGEPEKAEQELDQTRRRAQWELANNSGFLAGEQERILRDRLQRLEQQYATINDPNVTGRERELALERFRQRAGNVRVAVEGYREQMDAATDALASAAAIAAAILVVVIAAVLTPFTGGASAAAGAGILAAMGGALTSGTVAVAAAVAAATASVVVRQAMLGDAYSGEDMATDLAVGAVDALASYATAGLGAGLLKAARGGILARMAANSSRMTRFAGHALAEGAEGVVSTLPSALTGNLLNDRNWDRGSPFVNILAGTAMETGIGAVVSAGMGGVGGLRALEPPPAPRATGDILAHRGTPQDRLAQWRAYKEEHPNASMQEFIRQFDAGVATRLAEGDAARQLQRQLRTELLKGIPAAQRRRFSNAVIEVMPDADFERLTRSRAGQAVVLIEEGRPRVILREGADPSVLREEGIHLLQSVDPRWRGRGRALDERRLADWDKLDLEEQLALYRKKIELEIDAQERLLRNLDSQLSEAGDKPTRRHALRSQMEQAEQTLENLRRRGDEVQSLGPDQRLQIARGEMDPPQYLEQPPRLFGKRSVLVDPRPPRGDPNAVRRPVDNSALSSKQENRVYQVGNVWREQLPDGTVRNYRLVEVLDNEGRVKLVREEIQELDAVGNPRDSWRQRGEESAGRGRQAERASRLWSDDQLRRDANRDRLFRIDSQHGGGAGFDEVLVRFNEKGEATIIIVEVKDYSGYVPFQKFTANARNLPHNIEVVRGNILNHPDLTPSQRVAALRAVDEWNYRLEVRLGSDTKLGMPGTTNSVLSRLQEVAWLWRNLELLNQSLWGKLTERDAIIEMIWRLDEALDSNKFKSDVVEATMRNMRARIEEIAARNNVSLGEWELGIAYGRPHPIPPRHIVRARAEQAAREGLGKKPFGYLMIDAEKAGIAIGPINRPQDAMPGAFIDRKGRRFIVQRPAASESPDSVAERIVSGFKPIIVGATTSIKSPHILVDTTGFNREQLGGLLRELSRRAQQTNSPEWLSRVQLFIDPSRVDTATAKMLFAETGKSRRVITPLIKTGYKFLVIKLGL